MEASTRRILLALATALGLALLTIAFLLGRISAKPGIAEVASAPSESPTPFSLTPAAGSVPTPPQASLASDFPSVDADMRPSGGVAGDSGAAAAARIETLAPLPPSAAVPSPQPSVAAYFAQVDRLEDMGAGDPEAFANSMMPALSSGDFTAFDDLLAKARAQRQRLQSLTPPPSCVEHHRLAVALSSDSVVMLERLKAALIMGDSLALMSIASDGRALEAKAAQLKAMGESIKKTAGV